MLNVNEEYLLSDVENYLINNTSMLIIGPQKDERTEAVYKKIGNDIRCIKLEYIYHENQILITPLKEDYLKKKSSCLNLDKVLWSFDSYGYKFKNILVDISSLQTPTIMALLNSLFTSSRCRPAKLFIVYAKPEKYLQPYMFSTKFGEASAIPGFIARMRENEILIPFLGFEGSRLRNIIGDVQYEKVIPIIGCPSDDPKWQFETMRKCMEAIKEQGAEYNIEKCKANSIFEAYYLLEEIIKSATKNYVLAPLGTKPHTVAATIFAIKHKTNCRLIYDFAIENYEQSSGVSNILVAHISCFL